MDASEYLDALCSEITRPETLNALHACRNGHPLGRGTAAAFKWRNAHSLVTQCRAYGTGRDYALAKLWLERQARQEAAENA